MNLLLQKVKEFVDTIYHGENPHFVQTLYWVEKLNPNANEALKIAAYSHDIERGFYKVNTQEVAKSKGFLDEANIQAHQERSAKVMSDFLKEQNATDKLINEVVHLIEKHETGGDEMQNLLKDADSISFLETNVDHFINKYAKEIGKEKVRDKFDYMFNRITSEKAKVLAKPLYEKAVKELLTD
jgi:predicted transcriptional regulator